MYNDKITLAVISILSILVIALVANTLFSSNKSDTIVIDASDYIAKELKESEQRVQELDQKYKELFLDFIQEHKQLDSIKAVIKNRNRLIDHLKIQVNKNETTTNINLTDVQHDSLFSRFLQDSNKN